MVGTSLTGLAEPGSAHWVELAVWLALLTGALQIVLGIVRFGWLHNVISSPVLMGFTQAAGRLIISSQLPAMLGVEIGWRQWLAAPHLHPASAAFGLASLTLLVLARRWRPAFP